MKTTKVIQKKNGDNFKEKGYLVIKNFLNVKKYYKPMINDLQKGVHDSQCPKSLAIYNNKYMEELHEIALPRMEQATGLKLYKTYSYCRLYFPNEELKKHTDRPSCEISATVCIGYDGKNWPILIEDYSGNEVSVKLEPGDALIYHGCDMIHWRNPNKYSKNHVQVFLHYVDQNGSFASYKDDKH